MASTIYSYNLTGQRVFPVAFEYLARRFVKITLVGTTRQELQLNVDYRFISKTEIETTIVWAPGEFPTVEIRRVTSATDRLVNFTDGSILRSQDLNISQIQAIHIAEEGRDVAENSMLGNQFSWDALGRRISNLADPVLPTDAANAQFVADSLEYALRTAEKTSMIPFERANKILGFDSNRQPIMLIPSAGTSMELETALTDDVDPLKGSAMIGRNIVVVGSIQDLLAARRRPSLRYWVQNYYPGGKGGGNYWRWDPGSNAAENYGTVIKVPNVPVGRWLVIKAALEFTTEEFGIRPENTGVQNRLRLQDLFKHAANKAVTVKMMTEDCIFDASTPIIFGADSTIIGRGGRVIPVLELPLNPASIAANPDGTFKVYGGVFGGGDVVTGNRYSETSFPYRGTCTFINLTIANINNLTAASGYSLHGIISHGGIMQHINVTVENMPNTGIVSTMYREAHYSKVKCVGNGMLGGGGARNGTSNTSTYSIRNATFPEADRTKMLTCVNGIFKANFEEGIQYANCPFVYIAGNDCRDNLDRGIEGDSAYPQTVKTRPNDKIFLIDNDCRGVPGVSNHSITSSDGFNKDIVMSGNTLGGCKKSPLVMSCSSEGSVVFTGKNIFELTDVGLVQGCHAMYINAGVIDLSAGVVIRGSHDRSPFNAVVLSANNDLSSGSLTLGDITSDITFSHVLAAKSSSRVRVGNINCDTARSPIQVTLTGDMKVLEIADFDGHYNVSAATDQGLLRLIGMDRFVLDKLILKGNLGDGSTSNYPISVGATAVVGSIKTILSTGNYWADFKVPGGFRLTSLSGLAVKTSTLDMPKAV